MNIKNISYTPATADFSVSGDYDHEGEEGSGHEQAQAELSQGRHQGLGRRDHQRLQAEKNYQNIKVD